MLIQDENEPVEETICPCGHKAEFSIERDFIITKCMACNNLVTIYQRWQCPFCSQTETLMGSDAPFVAVQLCEQCNRLMVVGGGFDENGKSSTFSLSQAEQAKFFTFTKNAQWQDAAKEIIGVIEMFEVEYNLGRMADNR